MLWAVIQRLTREQLCQSILACIDDLVSQVPLKRHSFAQHVPCHPLGLLLSDYSIYLSRSEMQTSPPPFCFLLNSRRERSIPERSLAGSAGCCCKSRDGGSDWRRNDGGCLSAAGPRTQRLPKAWPLLQVPQSACCDLSMCGKVICLVHCPSQTRPYLFFLIVLRRRSCHRAYQCWLKCGMPAAEACTERSAIHSMAKCYLQASHRFCKKSLLVTLSMAKCQFEANQCSGDIGLCTVHLTHRPCSWIQALETCSPSLSAPGVSSRL